MTAITGGPSPCCDGLVGSNSSWNTLSRIARTCGWTSAYKQRKLVMFCTWCSAKSESCCTRWAKFPCLGASNVAIEVREVAIGVQLLVQRPSPCQMVRRSLALPPLSNKAITCSKGHGQHQSTFESARQPPDPCGPLVPCRQPMPQLAKPRSLQVRLWRGGRSACCGIAS